MRGGEPDVTATPSQLSTPEIIAIADELQDYAATLRAVLVGRGRTETHAHVLTGAWLAWEWAERARQRALDPRRSLSTAAYMLVQAKGVLDLLTWGPRETADTLMSIVLLAGRITLSAPETRAQYAAWVLREPVEAAVPLPVPYRPRPGRRPPWLVALYYRTFKSVRPMRLLHSFIALGV